MGLIPEGAKKNFKGREYILRDHRWRRGTDGQDLKTKFKPLSADREEALIDKATTESRLQHLARRYEAISQHADNLDLKKDYEDHDWLHNRANDRLQELQDSGDSDDFDDSPEKDPFWQEYADRHEVTRTARGHLQIRRKAETWVTKDGGTGTISDRTRTIGTNRHTGEFLVSDSAQTRIFQDSTGKITKQEVYKPAAVHTGSPVLQRYLRRFGDPKNGLKLNDVLRLSDRGSNLIFAAPRRNSLADTQLPFQQAIDYFAEKTNLDTDSWIEGQGIVQQAAFTVAAAKGALLQDIRTATAKAINQGISIAEFAKEFGKIADRYSANWELKGDRAWRGQLIYEQNLRQAYAAGRYAQMTDPETLRRRPYWQWRHGDSRNPRPVHLALDGKVFPADSLPWHVPLGFGCKCQIFSLSQRDIDRENLTVETLVPGQDINYTDPKTGQTRPIKLEPDKGFDWKPDRNLTPQRRAEILKNLAPDLQQQVEEEYLGAMAEGRSETIGEQSQVVLFSPASPQDIRQIEDWVDRYRSRIDNLTRQEQAAFSIAQEIQQQDIEDFRGIVHAGLLQSAATVLTEPDHMYIDFIASAPWNVADNQSGRVPKAATSLICSIAKESVEKGFDGDVRLDSIPSAASFYEQLGFTYNEEDRLYRLSPAAAKALIQKYQNILEFMADLTPAERQKHDAEADRLEGEYEVLAASPSWLKEHGHIDEETYQIQQKRYLQRQARKAANKASK
jgi:Phage Mu protein F like protein